MQSRDADAVKKWGTLALDAAATQEQKITLLMGCNAQTMLGVFFAMMAGRDAVMSAWKEAVGQLSAQTRRRLNRGMIARMPR